MDFNPQTPKRQMECHGSGITSRGGNERERDEQGEQPPRGERELGPRGVGKKKRSD